VVTFRSHIGIILILTLTIDAFVPEDSALGQLKVAGDYSAVFPLLTVAVFVALQISRNVIFYEKQRSRGDIQALPEGQFSIQFRGFSIPCILTEKISLPLL
jgi:hypothetical protein